MVGASVRRSLTWPVCHACHASSAVGIANAPIAPVRSVGGWAPHDQPGRTRAERTTITYLEDGNLGLLMGGKARWKRLFVQQEASEPQRGEMRRSVRLSCFRQGHHPNKVILRIACEKTVHTLLSSYGRVRDLAYAKPDRKAVPKRTTLPSLWVRITNSGHDVTVSPQRNKDHLTVEIQDEKGKIA
jgi:hypothetical protein